MLVLGLNEKTRIVIVCKSSSGFEVCSETPFSHRFKYQEQKPSNQKSFSSAVRKEVSKFLKVHFSAFQ